LNSSNDFEAVLFDLDGTLLDTANDLVGTVNTLLMRYGCKSQPIEALRPYVSQGGLKLISVAFGIAENSAEAEQLRKDYLAEYASRICARTVPFPGIVEVLQKLDRNQQKWGVVTNKPGYLTDLLMAKIELPSQPGCIVSGDTTKRAKPFPDPVLYACKCLKVAPEKTLIVGDDERDIAAGRAAGLTALGALWGYIQQQDDPSQWGADGLLDSAADLYGWID